MLRSAAWGMSFVGILLSAVACTSSSTNGGSGGSAGGFDAGGAAGGTGGVTGSGGIGGGAGSPGSGGQGGGGGAGGSSSGGTTGGGTGGSDAGSVVQCSDYCEAVMNACTLTVLQYANTATCNAACPAFKHGVLNDTSGDSLECRYTWALQKICYNAGPTGGVECGTNCEAYCDFMQAFCPGVVFDGGSCASACATILGSQASMYSAKQSTQNTLFCRIYYATLAAQNPSLCAAAAPVSNTCTDSA